MTPKLAGFGGRFNFVFVESTDSVFSNCDSWLNDNQGVFCYCLHAISGSRDGSMIAERPIGTHRIQKWQLWRRKKLPPPPPPRKPLISSYQQQPKKSGNSQEKESQSQGNQSFIIHEPCLGRVVVIWMGVNRRYKTRSLIIILEAWWYSSVWKNQIFH